MNRIVAAAIYSNRKIYSLPPPARHYDILHHEQWRDINEELQRGEQGFLLDNGKFCRRKAAAYLAEKNGQLKKPLMTPPNLYTEDLW